MTNRKFNQLYHQLNPAQRLAVDTIQGPMMVMAGPGTGKTQVLTLRIANILRQTDTPPDAILALAFTRSAVHLLRQRLVEIVGTVGYRVKIHTFHSFCHEVIRTYPEYFPRIIGATNALSVDQIRIMKEVIDRTRLKILRPYGAPYFYLQPSLAAIDRLKKENISPGALARSLSLIKDERPRRRTGELLKLYRGYETGLAAARLYDFNDMVMEVIRVLAQDNDFRLALAEEYQYLLADEHQDANQGQNELLRLLTNFDDSPNLFIVGDIKQAIFQFQGASLDNFNYFKRLYPVAALIELTHNYRSGQPILDAAGSLIGPRLEAGRRGVKASISLRVFEHELEESNWLASEIKNKPGRVAVIFRDNRDAEPIIETFEQAGVPFIVESESNVLRDIEIKKLILLFRAVYHFGDDGWLRQVLHLDFWQLPPLEVWRLNLDAERRKLSLHEGLRKKFPGLFKKLERWKRLSANLNFTDLFGLVLEESQFLPQLLKRRDAVDKLEKLQSFFEEMKNILRQRPDFDLADFISYLDLLEEQHIAINLRGVSRREGVRLLTAHKAKGLEFDQVYIIRALDGHWGGRRRQNFFSLPLRGFIPTSADELDAERRLFYVAITRGRQAVTVSYARSDDEGRHRLPSQFLEEISPVRNRVSNGVNKKLLTVIDMPFARRGGSRPEQRFRPRGYAGPGLADRAFISQLFLERGLSATALNNYLTCPLKYFFNNLLRVTKVQRRELLYGSAVHEALKQFFDRYRRSERISAAYLLASFRRALERQPLSSLDRPATVARGERALRGYFRTYHRRWPRAIINEFRIRGVLLEPELKLTGQIDKLEWLIVGGREVKVVDYKTGRPKTRREILGLNKNSTGDYFRQLVFYKLLLDHYERGKYQAVSGELDFIEPNERGEYRREQFELPAAAVEKLQELILRVAAEIRSLKFLNQGCDKPGCEACTLWRMMGGKLR
ncbi:MAG: ATP-dependent helicase [Candidatus Vogelbacteria bacterium]|nr:ATP-dependent helicase [Candidatus Vogelbacteria bacterium]